jgi:NCS1 family nucleobase:cation symporter-1
MFSVVVATLAVNIAANVVSPANDFANAMPRWISFRTGGLITGLVGIAMQPWRLLADPRGYIFAWLVGYSGGLGSIAGVLIADYWIVRRRALDLEDLYLPHGRYGAWNPAAVIATLAGLRAGVGRASWYPRSGRSTTTPGSWASSPPAPFTSRSGADA